VRVGRKVDIDQLRFSQYFMADFNTAVGREEFFQELLGKLVRAILCHRSILKKAPRLSHEDISVLEIALPNKN
jgi:hypothetical protein